MAIINISFFVFQVMMLFSGTNSYQFVSMKCTEIYAADVKADKINGKITLVIVMSWERFFSPTKEISFFSLCRSFHLIVVSLNRECNAHIVCMYHW